MRKIFVIEYPDDFGPEWLCLDNLKSVLYEGNYITDKATVKELKADDIRRVMLDKMLAAIHDKYPDVIGLEDWLAQNFSLEDLIDDRC